MDTFLFMTTDIRKFVPERAEYARIMKEAVIKVAGSIPASGSLDLSAGKEHHKRDDDQKGRVHLKRVDDSARESYQREPLSLSGGRSSRTL
jgi:hypothetical protein